MPLKWFRRCGAFAGRERTVRPEYKDSIFNRIALWLTETGNPDKAKARGCLAYRG